MFAIISKSRNPHSNSSFAVNFFLCWGKAGTTNHHWSFHPATSHYREGSQQLCLHISWSEFPFRFSLLHLYCWSVKAKMEKIWCCFNRTIMFLFCFCPLQTEVWVLSYSVQKQCLTFLLMLLLNLCSPHADVFWYQNLNTCFPTAVYAEMSQKKKLTTRFPLFLEKSCIQAWQ